MDNFLPALHVPQKFTSNASRFSIQILCSDFQVRGFRDQISQTPIPRRHGLDCACVLARRLKSTRPPRQTSGQRTEPQAGRLACPKTPTRPAPPPLRSPHPSLHFRQQSFVACRIDWRDQCAVEVLRCAAPLIVASVAASF